MDLRPGWLSGVLPVILVLSITPCLRGQTTRAGDAIIARAGSRFITEKEFVERFELLPGLQRHRVGRLPEAKLELLYSLVAEKLLDQEAAARYLDRDSSYLSALIYVRRLLARDELYRREVKAKVRVSEREISHGIRQALQQVQISFLYTPDSTDAAFLRSRIRTLHDFETIQVDSSLGIVADTATVIWGDADPAIESCAYRLGRSEISPVVRAGDGYYIMRVNAVRRNDYYSSLDPAVLRERVADLLHTRKERKRLNEYVDGFLKDETGYSRPAPFITLAKAVEAEFRAHASGQERIPFTDALADAVRRRCRGDLADTLAVLGNSAWSMQDVIDRLVSNGFNIDSASVPSTAGILNNQLRVWVQQELLADEALRQSLDTVKDVREQLDLWSDACLSDMMRDYAARRIAIPDSEVWAYLRSETAAVSIPKVQIRELTTASLEEMQEAMKALNHGQAFASVVAEWSIDSLERARGGISEFFPVTDRQPVGEIASQMEIGQRFGPLLLQNRYLLFELLARTNESGPLDTAFAAKWRAGLKQLRAMKLKETVSLLIAQSAQKRGYDIYEDRLKEIKVSPVPMMTYRILGFGGRMPAVPFVPREIEWLNAQPPATEVVP